MSSTTSPTLQICRECGGGAPVDAHFCPQCSKILSLGRHGDYFAFLGIPRKLHVDVAELERRYRDLSRQFHPDYFYNATPAERRASLERSSYLNDAYRTLKDPIARAEYVLKLEGLTTNASATPPGLLEEVFALNEELDEVRARRAGGAPREEIAARLERARTPIEKKRDEHEHDLDALARQWDASGDRRALEALRDRVLERNYINNLLASIEQEADPGR
jgi:molecular chaperone HscB